MYREPEVVWSDVEYLRARHLSLFSTALANQMGMELTPAYRVVSSDRCAGHADLVSKIGPKGDSFKLAGWAVDRLTRKPVKRIVLVAGDRIVGFAVSGFARSDVATALHSNRAFHSGWVGYAKVPDETGTIDVYGILKSGEANGSCPLATVGAGGPP